MTATANDSRESDRRLLLAWLGNSSATARIVAIIAVYLLTRRCLVVVFAVIVIIGRVEALFALW